MVSGNPIGKAFYQVLQLLHHIRDEDFIMHTFNYKKNNLIFKKCSVTMDKKTLLL